MHMKHFFFISALLFFTVTINAQVFTNVAGVTDTNHGNRKDGGVAWADFNNDGCLDLLFNTNTNNANNRSRMLFSDCSLPNPGFIDVTATNVNGLTQNVCERSVSVGDFNNDGNIDFCRNENERIEVYLNNGPSSTPAYSFGNAAQEPNFVLTAIPGGLNSEGLGWMDYDQDGWLDLIIENHNFGIDIYRNPADGTANFVHVTPNGHGLGLPNGGRTGDYMTLCDYDDNGTVDILARKENEFDLWTNTGAGTFVVNTSFNQNATNNNKGGVLFCDFDNDGDFDLFWSDNGVNEIFEQTGLNSGNFVGTNEPSTSSGVVLDNSIDGCSCGDVDNDGDVDLFLGGGSVGNSHLFLNNGDITSLGFTANNLGVLPSGNTEGNSFADYDNDGDLDLYVNLDNADNELWRNGLNDDNYIKVHVKRDLGNGVLRDDLGATVILKDCAGNILGGIRQVSSVKGHGSNDPAVVHFGLPTGNNDLYVVEVHYTTVNGVRTVLDTAVVPSSLTDQNLTIVNTSSSSGLDACRFAFLPIELKKFDAVAKDNKVLLYWETVSEMDNDHFTIEKSINGVDWEFVAQTDGAGTSKEVLSYAVIDDNPFNGVSYYRLKQTDFDGTSTYSEIQVVTINQEITGALSVYPNPTQDVIILQGTKLELETLSVYNVSGQNVTGAVHIQDRASQRLILDLGNLEAGMYVLKTQTAIRKIYKQ